MVLLLLFAIILSASLSVTYCSEFTSSNRLALPISQKSPDYKESLTLIKSNVNEIMRKSNPGAYFGDLLYSIGMSELIKTLTFKALKFRKCIQACDESYKYMHLHKIAANLAIDAEISPNIKVYILENYPGIAGTGSLWSTHPWIVIDKKWAESAPLNEFAAVIAHEIGHLKAKDNIHRTFFGSLTYTIMSLHFKSLRLISLPLRYLIEMKRSRSKEYKADLVAAKLVGSPSMIEFLQHHDAM